VVDGYLQREYETPYGGKFKCSIEVSYESLDDMMKIHGGVALTPVADIMNFQILGSVDARIGSVPIVHNARIVVPELLVQGHSRSLFIIGVQYGQHEEPLYSEDEEYGPQGWCASFMKKDTSLAFSRSAIQRVGREWLNREGKLDTRLVESTRTELDYRGWVSFDDKVTVVRRGSKHLYMLLEPTSIRQLVELQYDMIKTSMAESRMWDVLQQDKGYFCAPNAENLLGAYAKRRRH
jgi:hypothetical protein